MSGPASAPVPTSPVLSVAIITYNEADNIGACLESVAELADEIVVLDSYSDDATEAICRKIPKVRFLQHEFDGHIEQKNRALEHCQGAWILSIDADERVSPALAQSISEFLRQPPERIVGVRFPRLTKLGSTYIRHGGWYPNRRYRLVRNGRARWGGENPHDVIELDGPGTGISGDLLHHSFRDISDQVETVNQFSSIVALTRFKQGRRFRLWRLLLMPIWKWFELYLLKRGFLDGIRGMVVAVNSAHSAFLKEAKLHEIDVLNGGKPSNLGERYGDARDVQ